MSVALQIKIQAFLIGPIMQMKNFITVVCLFLTVSMVSAESLPVYFGTYKGSTSKGIYRSRLDLETGRLSEAVLVAETTNPSFIEIHPNGKFLYGSNRGHDSIVVYQIDMIEGVLTFVEHETEDIETPRNFNIDPTGKFCLVANQDGDSVVVFRIDQISGKLEPTGHKINIGKPVCVRFLLPKKLYGN